MELILKARRGEKLTDEDKENVKDGLRDILRAFGSPAPVDGRIVSFVARKPGPVAKFVGLSQRVDQILDSLYDLIILYEPSFNESLRKGDLGDFEEIASRRDIPEKGFLVELLGRSWLQDFHGYNNPRPKTIEKVRNIDAFCETSKGDTMVLKLAEIKSSRVELGKLRELCVELKKSFKEYRQDKDVKNIALERFDYVVFGPIAQKQDLKQKIRDALSELKPQESHLHDLDDIKTSCRENERVGLYYLKAIECLELSRIIG